jgi:lyso-ornithine lipid O-acyltransferase
LILTAFVAFTVPLMPVQALLLRCSTRAARGFPHWYHRQICRLFGVSLSIQGAVVRDRPVLVISNHVSWLDIPVLSAVAPVSFVAKKEVSSWPFVSSLARLQRSIFVDRGQRSKVGESASEILDRLAIGDAIVLFPEGTSSDGNRVLAFKTSLFGAVKPSANLGANRGDNLGCNGGLAPENTVVQLLAIAYTRRHGLALSWADRRALGYYGDISLGQSALDVFTGGPLEASISISEPMALSAFLDRKDLARHAEVGVRRQLVGLLRKGRSI